MLRHQWWALFFTLLYTVFFIERFGSRAFLTLKNNTNSYAAWVLECQYHLQVFTFYV